MDLNSMSKNNRFNIYPGREKSAIHDRLEKIVSAGSVAELILVNNPMLAHAVEEQARRTQETPSTVDRVVEKPQLSLVQDQPRDPEYLDALSRQDEDVMTPLSQDDDVARIRANVDAIQRGEAPMEPTVKSDAPSQNPTADRPLDQADRNKITELKASVAAIHEAIEPITLPEEVRIREHSAA